MEGIAKFYIEGYNERVFISMNRQRVSKVEIIRSGWCNDNYIEFLVDKCVEVKLMEMLTEIRNEVKEACLSDKNKFGYGIWSHHIISVVENSKKLAEIVSADMEIVELAALLHDYAGIKDYAMYEEHHLYSAIEAEMILKKYNYPSDRIAKVKDCIISHRGSIEIDKLSKEAICVADADAIAHIENVPSLLYLAYTNKGLSIDDGVRWVNNKIKRSWNKLSPLAKNLIKNKYTSCKLILE